MHKGKWTHNSDSHENKSQQRSIWHIVKHYRIFAIPMTLKPRRVLFWFNCALRINILNWRKASIINNWKDRKRTVITDFSFSAYSFFNAILEARKMFTLNETMKRFEEGNNRVWSRWSQNSLQLGTVNKNWKYLNLANKLHSSSWISPSSIFQIGSELLPWGF